MRVRSKARVLCINVSAELVIPHGIHIKNFNRHAQQTLHTVKIRPAAGILHFMFEDCGRTLMELLGRSLQWEGGRGGVKRTIPKMNKQIA